MSPRSRFLVVLSAVIVGLLAGAIWWPKGAAVPVAVVPVVAPAAARQLPPTDEQFTVGAVYDQIGAAYHQRQAKIYAVRHARIWGLEAEGKEP